MAKRQPRPTRQKNVRKELKLLRANASKAGQAPGTLTYVGDQAAVSTLATLIEYDAHTYKETQFANIEAGQHYQTNAENIWLNIHGLDNIQLLTAVGREFGLHPLVLEDILNTEQRPKVDIYPDYLFVITHIVSWNEQEECLASEQISIVLGKNHLLTFQEKSTGTFSEIRTHLQSAQTQIRKSGLDYLLYAMLDKITDRYFTVLEGIGEAIESLEDRLVIRAHQSDLQHIHALRRELLQLRRSLWPLREIINTLLRDEIGLFHKETQLYLHGVYDHTIHLIESMEAIRDLVSSMQESYMSTQANTLNLQMRLLTVITTMFMPLTLIGSIYGMNFENMPELHWQYGYHVVLGVMAAIAAGMGYFFWRRRWFD